VFTTVSESTLQDSAAPQTNSAATNIEESRLVLGNRQIAAALFVVLALVTLIAALSYVAGRATPDVSPAPVATSVRSSQQAPEQVIVVDAKPAAAQTLAAAPTVTAPVVTPTAAPAAAAVAPVAAPPPVAQAVISSSPDAPPTPGTVYLQVASVDKGMADVSVQYLREKGFQARRAPGASPALYRVLVGPVGASGYPDPTEGKLKELGFTPFPKKY